MKKKTYKVESSEFSDRLTTSKNQAWLVVGSEEQSRFAIDQYPGRPPEVTIWCHPHKFPVRVNVWVYGSKKEGPDGRASIRTELKEV